MTYEERNQLMQAHAEALSSKDPARISQSLSALREAGIRIKQTKFSDEDRDQLLQLNKTKNDESLPMGTREQAARDMKDIWQKYLDPS